MSAAKSLIERLAATLAVELNRLSGVPQRSSPKQQHGGAAMKQVYQAAALAILPLAAAPNASFAQQAPTRAEAQAALTPAPAQFTDAQLDQVLAPIALYPDQLLTEVL